VAHFGFVIDVQNDLAIVIICLSCAGFFVGSKVVGSVLVMEFF